MALRQCFQRVIGLSARQLNAIPLRPNVRGMSSASHVLIDMDSKKKVATLKLNRGPVNSLNLELLQDIINTVEALEKGKDCRGLIITSNLQGLFCAGLDITELYQPDIKRLRDFWIHVQELWLRLYGSKLIVISAINGHCPAGGCLMSITPDYRIMAEGKYKIGLNETLLGMVAPKWFQLTMKNTIGQRHTERALQIGHLFPAKEALDVGLVDQLVPEEQVLSTAEAQMDVWLKIPDEARQMTKLSMRKPTIDWMLERRQKDTDFFVDLLTKESTQRAMGYYVESMKKKAVKN